MHPTVLIVLSLLLASCAQAPEPAEAIITRLAYGGSEPMSMLSDLSVAQERCASGGGDAGYFCSLLDLASAERELQEAESDYFRMIQESGTSQYEPPTPGPSEEDWHAVFQASQDRWRQLRDANCALVAVEGGSGAGNRATACLAEETLRRTARLWELRGVEVDAMRPEPPRPVHPNGASSRSTDRVTGPDPDPVPRPVPRTAEQPTPPAATPARVPERSRPLRPDPLPRPSTQADSRPTSPDPPSAATRPEPRPTESAGAWEGTGQSGRDAGEGIPTPVEAGFQFGNRSFTCPSPPNDGTLEGTVVYSVQFAPNGRYLSGRPRSRNALLEAAVGRVISGCRADALPSRAAQVPQTTTATFRFSAN